MFSQTVSEWNVDIFAIFGADDDCPFTFECVV